MSDGNTGGTGGNNNAGGTGEGTHLVNSLRQSGYYGGTSGGKGGGSSGGTTTQNKKKYPVPLTLTPSQGGGKINYVQGADGTYIGISPGGKIIATYKETQTPVKVGILEAINKGFAAQAEKKTQVEYNAQNYTPAPKFALAQPVTGLMINNVLDSGKPKTFEESVAKKRSFNVSLYDENYGYGVATLPTNYGLVEEQQRQKTSSMEYTGFSPGQVLSFGELRNKKIEQFNAAMESGDQRKQGQVFVDTVTQNIGLGLQKTGNFIEEKTRVPNNTPLGMRVSLSPIEGLNQGAALTRDIGTNMVFEPQKQQKEFLTSALIWTGVGGITGYGLKTIAAKESVGVLGKEFTGMQVARTLTKYGGTTLGVVGASSILYTGSTQGTKGIADITPSIIGGGIGFSAGFQGVAPTKIEISNTMRADKVMTFENIDKNSFYMLGKGYVPARITEFGVSRNVNIPVETNIASDALFKNNEFLVSGKITGKYSILGKETTFEEGVTGSIKNYPKSSRLWLETDTGKEFIGRIRDTQVMDNLRQQSIFNRKLQYGTFQKQGNIYYANSKGNSDIVGSSLSYKKGKYTEFSFYPGVSQEKTITRSFGDITVEKTVMSSPIQRERVGFLKLSQARSSEQFGVGFQTPSQGVNLRLADIGFRQAERSGRFTSPFVESPEPFIVGRRGRSTFGFSEQRTIIENPRPGGILRNDYPNRITSEGLPVSLSRQEKFFMPVPAIKNSQTPNTIQFQPRINTNRLPMQEPSITPSFIPSSILTPKVDITPRQTTTPILDFDTPKAPPTIITKPPGIDILTPPPVPFTLPNFALGGNGFDTRGKKSKRSFYAPSLTAGILNIRGTPKQKYNLTGLEIRPMTRK